jgi:ATP-dependent DNA helicase 2 subunit 1
VRRKAEFTSTIELGPDLRLGVKGYLTLLHKRPQRSYWVYNKGEESRLVHTESRPMNAASGRIVDKDEIRRGYKFGDKLITLTPAQHESIREIDSPVIRIIGFKPLEAVRPRYNLTHPRFVYPSDAALSGSVRAFSCLHQAMLKKRRAAIAWCVLRANNTPRLYALLPVQEESREMKRGPYAGKRVQYTPDGFFLVQLPFRDDIREPPLAATKKTPSQELVDALDGVIDGIQMSEGYTPERYANKYLEDFNRILQAKALEEELPEHFKDNTVPSYKSINKRVGEKVEAFNKMLDELTRLDIAKRPASEAPSAAQQTKARKREVSDADIVAAAKNGNLERYTRDQLRAFATSKNIDYGHKKADAVEAVKKYVNSI